MPNIDHYEARWETVVVVPDDEAYEESQDETGTDEESE